MLNTLFLLFFIICLLIFFSTALLAGLLAAPWLPTRGDDINRLLSLAKLKQGDLIYDLGSGDGRLLIAAAKKYQVRGVGFELSLFHYLWSRLKVYLAGCQKNIKITYKDFFRENLSPAQVVVCFLTPRAMNKLQPKIKKEMSPGSRFISYSFKLPEIPAAQVSKPTQKSIPIYLYIN